MIMGPDEQIFCTGRKTTPFFSLTECYKIQLLFFSLTECYKVQQDDKVSTGLRYFEFCFGWGFK